VRTHGDVLPTGLRSHSELPLDPVNAFVEARAGNNEMVEFGAKHDGILGNFVAPTLHVRINVAAARRLAGALYL
jgi:hypothetical protein